MLDNHDEISPETPRDTQTVLGTNGQDGDCQQNGSVDFAGWTLPRAAENVVNLISLETAR